MSNSSTKGIGLSEQKLELLASILDQECAESTEKYGIKRRENIGQFPLSATQRRMWFLSELEKGIHYNETFNLRLSGSLDIPALARALTEIVKRHEAMRAVFSPIQGQPVQRILPPEEVDLLFVDLTNVLQSDREPTAMRLAVEEARTPFDLAKGPLWRFTLLSLGDTEHFLLITAHHIAVDGWSLGLLLEELGVLYGAFRKGVDSPLPELGVQYADYAAWQTEWMESKAAEKQLQYWVNHLAGAPLTLELPSDRTRPPVKTFCGSRYRFALSAQLTNELKNLSRLQGVTLFMVLMTAFQSLIQRYTGIDDIVVGTPIANRTESRTQDLIGCFLNTLVLRNDLSGNPTFSDLLRRVRQTTLDAFANQELPLDKLVEALHPDRSRFSTPWLGTLFVFENSPMPVLELPGLSVSHFDVDNRTAKFDLTLCLFEGSNGLTGWFEYATALFDEARIERMAGHLQTLLEGIVANPNQRLSELPIITPRERQQLLVEWNHTEADYPADLCLQELFERQVMRTPAAIAVDFNTSQLTFRDLNERSNRLAHYLRSKGVGPDTLVAICMERSLEMVVALHGVLKAGGAYLPIDPDYPAERVAFMLNDAAAPVLITQRGLADRLPQHNSHVILLDEDWHRIARESPANPAKQTKPDNLAYMIYTSGSTGQPKGALNTHRGICNRLLWMQDRYQLTATDKVLQKTPFSFDVSVWEFFWPSLTGARLILARPGGHRDPAYLVDLIRAEEITIAHFVPSMLALFLDEFSVRDCRSLRHVICSGEALSFELQEKFFELLPAELHNLYGPTEAAVDVSYWMCQRDSEQKIVPIGRPVANTQLYICDRHMQLAPVGVPGELFIGGVQVGRGYHNRPELTAERFVPDPYRKERGARLYKSGDLCRWLSDGNIQYLGRTDFQVKIRGLRVELGEIENALRSLAGVRDAVVALRTIDGDDQLLAYIVSSSETHQSPDELRRQLKKRLPDYMVPSVFVALKALPLTPNGKIDRKALPAPNSQRPETGKEFVAPKDAVQKKLAHVWSEVLHLPRIGIHDSFFDLGGHSLLAMKAVSRIRDAFGVELSLQTFFSQSTIAGLAKVLASTSPVGVQGRDSDGLPRIEPRGHKAGNPISFAQEGLWFLDHVAPGMPLYNIVEVISFSGFCNHESMEGALNEVVRRHESLRTCFPNRNGQPNPVVHPALELSLPELDLSDLPPAKREAEWMRAAREEGQRAFDLSSVPLLRALLIRLSADEHLLVLTIHHIVADEWSMEILRKELQEIYDSFRERRPSPLAELSIQYADFASWQRQWVTGDFLESKISYWREELAGAPALLELPTDKPRPRLMTFRGNTEMFELPKDLLVAAKALGSTERATLFMVLEAAFMALLYRYTGQQDVMVGTPVSLRARSETEALIGNFLNTVVLRGRFSQDLSFRELLRQVREMALRAYACKEPPFERIVAEMTRQRSLSYMPLFQVMFVLYNSKASSQTSSQASKVTGLRQLATGTSKFDLTLNLRETDTGLQALIEYSSDLFEANTIRRMFDHYRLLLDAFTREPDQSISTVPMISDSERQQFRKWNETASRLPDTCVHQLIEQQTARLPNQVAVTYGNDRLTYADLDNRANLLARHLARLGVGRGVLVGLLVERSLDMMVALLAVLKAGGTYLPLDPSFPPDRLDYMVKDSALTVLVTHRGLETRLASCPASLVRLDADWNELAKQPSDTLLLRVNPDDLAYVLYTSGSTGRPKGVEIRHSSLMNILTSMQREPGFTAQDTLLAVTTLSFDIAGLELYLPLISGGKLVIAGRDDAHDPARLMNLLQDSSCTVMQATPATWHALLHAGWKGSSSLRILCGGESLPPELAQELLPRCSELWNLYGPTETTIWSSVHKVTSVSGPVPIGHPIANTQCFVLDAKRNLIPPGIIGEIYIGGLGLARGYVNRPQLTDQRFILSPFDPTQRLYRTGDLGRWRADGTLECLGRSDNQVKIRGFRVEMGEIEATLGEHPAIRQAVVAAREDHLGLKHLVAYLQPHNGAVPSASELRSYLKDRLPDYMLPSAFVPLDEFPMTDNGKIDRKALPAPETDLPRKTGEYVAPQSDVEKALAKLWCEILNVKRAGIHDDFFDLGGDSFTAIRLIAGIKKLTGRDLPVATLFQAPAIRELAEILSSQSWSPSWSHLVPLQPHGTKPTFYCVHGGDGNLMLYRHLAKRLGPDYPFYGLQPRESDGRVKSVPRIEDLAVDYLREIRKHQPEGPYYLGGFCVGGRIAFEMARQLQKEDQKVALLALIDSYNYDGQHKGSTPEQKLRFLFERVGFHVDNALKLRGRERLTYFGGKLRYGMGRETQRWTVRVSNYLKWLQFWNGHRPNEVFAEDAYIDATFAYKPLIYSGDVTVFGFKKYFSKFDDPQMGWGRAVSGHINVVSLSTNPGGIFIEPFVNELAAGLRSSMQRSEE